MYIYIYIYIICRIYVLGEIRVPGREGYMDEAASKRVFSSLLYGVISHDMVLSPISSEDMGTLNSTT